VVLFGEKLKNNEILKEKFQRGSFLQKIKNM
jgi:hypothetical protein